MLSTQIEKQLKERLHQRLKEAAYSPPSLSELTKELNTDEKRLLSLLRLLIDEGKVIKVKEGLYFDADLITTLKQKLSDYIKKHGSITPSEFKSLTNASRKYNIPLLEYLDRIKLTVRKGDKRVLL